MKFMKKYRMPLIVICLLIIIGSILIYSSVNSLSNIIEIGKEKMTDFVTNEAIPSFNQKCGINDITISNLDFKECGTFADSTILDCKVELESKEIEKYSTITTEDKDKIEELLNIFRNIYSIRAEFPRSSYSYMIKKREITFNFELGEYYSSIIINDTNGKSYKYTTNGDSETLSTKAASDIISTVLFQKMSESYEKRSSSSNNTTSNYSENYDAELRQNGASKVMIFISEDAMKRFMTALDNNNQGTIDELFSEGQVAYTENGTKCNIVEKKLTKVKVKLLDGLNAGTTVWVVIEAVQEK